MMSRAVPRRLSIRRLIVATALALGLAAVAAGCVAETEVEAEVELFVSEVTGVDATGEARLDAGVLDPGTTQGPRLVVGESAAVVVGGSIQQTVTSSDPFVAVRVAVADGSAAGAEVAGYWEISFAEPVTEASVVLSVPQELTGDGFVTRYAAVGADGVQGVVVEQEIETIEVDTGRLQVSVSWDAESDLDLHLIEPSGEEIFYGYPSSFSGGTLDLDSNAGCLIDSIRNENIGWEDGTPDPGEYVVALELFDSCGTATTSYVVTVVRAGEVTQTYTGTLDAGSPQATVATFQVGAETPPPAEPVRAELDATTPSTVSNLRTIAEATPSPAQYILLLVSSGVLTLLVALPGAVLSGIVAARWDDWFRWARRPVDALRRVSARPQHPVLFAAGILVASLASAFIDPRFGLNGMSVRLYLTQLAAILAFNVGGWFAVRAVVRRIEPDLPPPALQLRLGSLIVLVLSVVASRLLSFDPGIAFGLVAGLVYAGALLASRRAVVVLVGSGFAALAVVVAWAAYSLSAVLAPSMPGVPMLGVAEFFGGVTIIGAVALPISLLPFAIFEGAEIWGWNRAVWTLIYFVASALFLLTMVTVPDGITPISGDFLRWVGIFVAFALIAGVLWVLHRRLPTRSG